MDEPTDERIARDAAEYLRGICPHQGESFRVCKSAGLCDCEDYPEFDDLR